MSGALAQAFAARAARSLSGAASCSGPGGSTSWSQGFAADAKAAAPKSNAFKQKTKPGKKGQEEMSAKQQQIIDLLQPELQQRDHSHPPKYSATRLEQYRQMHEQRQAGWEYGLLQRWHLQKAALTALPAELRRRAMQPDLSDPPLNRLHYLDSPPEAYRDPPSSK